MEVSRNYVSAFVQKLHVFKYGENYSAESEVYIRSVYWNGSYYVFGDWKQIALKSDVTNKFKNFNPANEFVLNNRVADKILTINSTDNNGNGISIDFDVGSKQIRLYEMSNGNAIHTYRADLIIVG